MDISLVWEHNGPDTLLYAIDLPGAFTRGESFYHALDKLPGAVRGYLRWMGRETPEEITRPCGPGSGLRSDRPGRRFRRAV